MAVDLETMRTLLIARRDALEKESTLSREARATVTLDQQSVGRLSRMDAMQMQAMADAQERSRTADMMRVKAALARLEDDPDEFGYCTECGEEIAPARLKVDPSATRCVGCAA